MNPVLLLFILNTIISIGCLTLKNHTGLDRLFHKIFVENEYNNIVRPYFRDDITHVETELKLLQIDLDEKYQQLISTAWVEMTWKDHRLSWNPEEFNGIKEITLGVEKIWVPDIVLQNGVGQNQYLEEYKYFNPWILHTGLVTWVPEVKLHTKCVIKVADFPFDTQCCEINFYSWAHTSSQLEMFQFGDKNYTNLTHLAYNTEWVIYNTCAHNTTIKTSQDLDWWVTSYVIYIKRESIYHIYTLLMPCGVLSILSALLFWLPPDSDEKITLGVTILLAFFVNSLVVSNYTPEAASELPVIGVYYTFNIFLVAFSLSGTVFILKLHFRGHKINRVPQWVKDVFFIKTEDLRRKSILANEIEPTIQNEKSNSRSSELSYSFTKLNSDSPIKNFKLINNSLTANHHSNHVSFLSPNKYEEFKDECIVANATMNKIIKFIKLTMRKLDEEKIKLRHLQEINIEWKELARKLENVFFVITFIAIVIMPVYLFGKFVLRDIRNEINISKCGCENSFVKNY